MRTLRTYATCWLLSIAIVVQSCHWLLAEDSKQLEAAPSPEAIAFFESKIRPVLIQRCIECHRDADPESGLSLESRAAILRGGKLGPALVPGNPKESLLISAINHDEFLKMPPKDKLSTAELVDFAKWVTMGAPWPASTTPAPTTTSEPAQDGTNRAVEFSPEQKAFWAYQPLQPAALPEVKQSDWGHSPIDAFILEKLEQKGLSPAAPASKAELIRRATYDLTGLPPTREQIDQFVADQSPDAFAKLIDRLLASPHYGEHWGRHWLDVARFADSNGLDENIAYANAFRYRDYVTSSLNNDKTYDRFVQEQIAGDLLDIDSDTANGVGDPLDRFVATGFLAIGAKMLAEDDPVKMQMDIIDEQLSTLCQAFMGITIGCARCHDHKFDPITAADYYALAGIFKSTQTMENHKVVARWYERPLVSKADQEQLQRIDREIELTNQKITKLQQDCRKRVATEIRQTIAAALLTEREYDQFSQAAATRLSQGQNHPDRAYSVPTGYALIEAEGFQRGKAERDLDNYGKGIGVIISHGASFVEYDLEIDRPGRYALEMRHAAEERRPVRVLIDGAEANPAIAVEITGNWQPEGQQWFVETMLELPAGKHVLRLETSKKTPFPHIDKFALVHQTTEPALNGETPLALSRVGASLGISYPLLAMWQKYLGELRKATDKTPEAKALFELWTQFRNIRKDFSAGATPLYESLGSQLATDADPLAKLRGQLKETKPSSLAAVAQIFDTFIAGVLAASPADLENKKLDDLRKQLLSDNSPLSGPKKDFEPFYNLSEQEQTQQLNKELAELRQMRPNPPMAMGVTESKPEDLRIHLRGSHIVLGKMVPRRFPQILAGTEAPTFGEQASGRLELARWMTRPEHPLTSRVMVNRLWHWHFGRGLVTSVDNFGLLGQKPSHPELLDWLAIRFVQQRWSIKQMHRTLMLSQTYQMSTDLNTAAAAIDPSNDWLWRFRRRRLTAEETRDSIISVGEGLDRTLYGTLLQTENHKYVNSTGSAMAMDASRGRRSLYLPVIRSGVFDVMQTLDFPDPAMLSGERQTSTVAPQALLMMNSDLVHEHTAIIARQLLSDCRDDAERISQAYSRILQRSPSIDEVIAAATFIRQARQVAQHVVENQQDNSAATSDTLLWQGLCRVLISSNEFSYVE